MRSGIVAPADSLKSVGSSCDSLCWPPEPLDMLAAAAAHPQLVRALDEDRSSTADSGLGPHHDAPSSPPTPTARPRSSTPFAADEDEAQEEPSTPPCVRSSPLQCPGAPRSRPAPLLHLPNAGLRSLRPPPLIVGPAAAALAAAAAGSADMCSSPARSSRTYFAAAGGDGSSTVLLPPPPFLAFPTHQQQDKWEQQQQAEATADACLVPLLASALQQTNLLSVTCRGPGPLPGQTPAFDWRCDSSDAREGGEPDAAAAAAAAAAAGLLGLEDLCRCPANPQQQQQEEEEEEACEQTLSSSSSGVACNGSSKGAGVEAPGPHHHQQQQQQEEGAQGPAAAYGAADNSSSRSSRKGVYSSLRLTLPSGPPCVRRPLIDSLTRSGLDSLAGAATCLTPVAAARAAAEGRQGLAASVGAGPHTSCSGSGKATFGASLDTAAAASAAAAAAPAAWLDLLEQRLSARDAAAAAAAAAAKGAACGGAAGGGGSMISHKRAHSPGGATNKRQHRLHQQQLVGVVPALAADVSMVGAASPPPGKHQHQLMGLSLSPPLAVAVTGPGALQEVSLPGGSGTGAVCLPGGGLRSLPPPGLVALRMMGYHPAQL